MEKPIYYQVVIGDSKDLIYFWTGKNCGIIPFYIVARAEGSCVEEKLADHLGVKRSRIEPGYMV